MTGDLLARIVNQAADYGTLMLTVDELHLFTDWTTAHPLAAFALGPGRIIVADAIPVHVLDTAGVSIT